MTHCWLDFLGAQLAVRLRSLVAAATHEGARGSRDRAEHALAHLDAPPYSVTAVLAGYAAVTELEAVIAGFDSATR